MNNRTSRRNLHRIVDNTENQTPDGLYPTPGYIKPTSAQRERALAVLSSDDTRELLELKTDARKVRLGEMVVAAEAADDPDQVSTLTVLDKMNDRGEWGRISLAIEQEPGSRVYDAVSWIIASHIAQNEYTSLQLN